MSSRRPPLAFRWGILFSHPRDFTPVCTTELGRAAKLAPEFSKRNVKMIALSIDSVPDHLAWSKVGMQGSAAAVLRRPEEKFSHGRAESRSSVVVPEAQGLC